MKLVHCFDVGGTVINMKTVGQRYVELYKTWSKEKKIDETIRKKTISDYEARLREESWAIGLKKKEIINALEGTLHKQNVYISGKGIFFEDTLQVFKDIAKAGQSIILFATADILWLKNEFPEEIRKNIVRILGDDKTNPAVFTKLVNEEKAKGHQIISHTADTLQELKAAKEIKAIPNLFFIDRHHKEKKEEVEKVAVFLSSMKEADYTHLNGK